MIQHQTGKKTADLSHNEHEQEVLFPPGTRFRVQRVFLRNGDRELEQELHEYRCSLAGVAGQPGRIPSTIIELSEVVDEVPPMPSKRSSHSHSE